MEKITVIVPIYNVEEYLNDSINSIVNQTYKNLEIILVNDGSTDNSKNICEAYRDKYENIILINKENGGLSDSRNAGLEVATGKYIMFVDSDDTLYNNSCEVMYNAITSKKANFVTANYINMDDDGTVWKIPIFDIQKYKNFKLDINDYRDSFFVMNSSVCNKIFDKQFIDENNFRFKVGIPAEDAVFTTLAFIKSDNVWYIPDIMYKYRQRKNNNSISNNCSLKYFNGINTAYKDIYDNFNDNNELSYYRLFYAKSMTYMLYKFIDSELLSDEDRIEILSNMRWFYRLSITLNVPACQKSLSIVIDKIIEGQYKEVINMCKIIADIRIYMSKEEKAKMTKPTSLMYEEILKNNIL